MQLAETSLAQVLEPVYRTAVAGKWHLSVADGTGPLHPLLMGFEHHVGSLSVIPGFVGDDYYLYEKSVDGTTQMWGQEASYDRRSRVATLRGNVRIEEGTARITGREATFYRNENRSVIVGTPRLQDSTRTLTADRIEHDRTNNVVTAIG